MDIQRFSDQLRAARQRLSQASSSCSASEASALAELETACEALNVAEEELRQENEERRRTREALELERERNAALFALPADGCVVTDGRGVILEASPAARERLGLPVAAASPSLASFVEAEERPAFRRHLAQALATGGGRQQWECRMVPPGREPFDACLTVAPSGGSRGVQLFWLLEDTAERRALLERVQRQPSEVASAVAIRTAELTAAIREKDVLLEEARSARAEAERANAAKDAFLATLSHELRTPLTAILGWSHVLRQRHDEDMRRRALDAIDRSAHAQVKLVEDILDVSRIVSDRLALEPGLLDLSALVETAVNALRPALQEAEIQLTTRIETDVPVCADGDRLQQVVWNVLANAVKFTPRGGHIDLELARRQGQAVVTVKDSGKGISPEFLPFVFDRFRQAATTRSQGLGLGLTIARHIVERHGGRITASSEGLGRGSTFTLELPVAVGGAPWPAGLDRRQRTRTGYLIGGLVRVLVVEDDPDTREALAASLAEAGFEVETAACVREAVRRFEVARPDVVVSDIALPEEDGCTLVSRLRRLDDSGHFGAIAVTAYASADEESRARSCGFDEYVAKPAAMTDLTAAVTALALRSERPH